MTINSSNPELVKVTQADREQAELAYLDCYDEPPNEGWLAALLAGKHDNDPLVQGFARHRADAILTLSRENERLRESLEQIARSTPDVSPPFRSMPADVMRDLARRTLAASQDSGV